MTILYFTSTGNSLMVAKKLGGQLVSIPQAMRSENYKFEDDAIGLVFPVYGLSVPPLILDFMKKAELHTKYLFAILTYGTYDGAAMLQLQNAAIQKHLNFSYINHLHMQENYLPGFAMEKQKKPKNQDKKLNQICMDIAEKKHDVKKNSWFDKFMTKTHEKNYHYTRGIGVMQKYNVKENCLGCGTCVEVCPTKNIKICGGKLVFGQDCLSCFACTHNCPVNAIRLTTQKSDKRYRNPEVTLEEIMEQFC